MDIRYYELSDSERKDYLEALRIVAEEIRCSRRLNGTKIRCPSTYIFEKNRILLNKSGAWALISDIKEGIIPIKVLEELEV